MSDLSGVPYREVEFTKDGDVHDSRQPDSLVQAIRDERATDLLVVSHGWNNDMAEARRLYERLFESFAEVNARHPLADRRLLVLGVLWPSKRFAETDLQPGGGAATLNDDEDDEAIRAEIDALAGALQDAPAEKVRKLRDLAADLEGDRDRQAEFVRTLREIVPPPDDARRDGFYGLEPAAVLERLSLPMIPASPGAEGAAAGLWDVVDGVRNKVVGGVVQLATGVKAGARRALNLATYYLMKECAGTVGRRGLNPLLAALRQARGDLRIHLVGHSFGGRLVTAAAAGPAAVEAASLTLLQAAFSHHGFAEDFDGGRDGAFRGVIRDRRVRGPIVVTHTRNDKAVGLAYPLASRLIGDDAASIGGPDSRWGGLGSNGAQKTPEAVSAPLLAVAARYDFVAGRVHNLLADPFIADHGSVHGREVAWAIHSVIAMT